MHKVYARYKSKNTISLYSDDKAVIGVIVVTYLSELAKVQLYVLLEGFHRMVKSLGMNFATSPTNHRTYNGCIHP